MPATSGSELGSFFFTGHAKLASTTVGAESFPCIRTYHRATSSDGISVGGSTVTYPIFRLWSIGPHGGELAGSCIFLDGLTTPPLLYLYTVISPTGKACSDGRAMDVLCTTVVRHVSGIAVLCCNSSRGQRGTRFMAFSHRSSPSCLADRPTSGLQLLDFSRAGSRFYRSIKLEPVLRRDTIHPSSKSLGVFFWLWCTKRATVTACFRTE